MSADLEELESLLYPNGIPENEDLKKYVIELASCGADKLAKEGSYLKDEKNHILEETRELVYKNYKTFIHSAECSHNIFKEFSNVEGHLGKVIEDLPVLKRKVNEFLDASHKLSQSRHTTSLTLTKHTQLLEILELPQLMDTCVRNGYYDDALEIVAYVKRLEKKHSDIPLIESIVSEVVLGTRLMLLQLLQQLRSAATLPQCLKAVGLLRRLDFFSDAELKVKFLQARDSWFSALIRAIPTEDPFEHMTKVIETCRVHLFDIVTQYRAIFAADDDARFSAAYPTDVADYIHEKDIFHEWIAYKIRQFLFILESDLERGVGPNLESLLDQCMFFGQSFSRIGADFRTLLVPIFQRAAINRFAYDVRAANAKFDESLSSFSLLDSVQMRASTILTETPEDTANPPLSLMEFIPVAHYTNGLVASFNHLRLFCPVAILGDAKGILSKSLAKVCTAMIELHRLEACGMTRSECEAFSRMCSAIANALGPHVNRCLAALFPCTAIASITGISVHELQEKKIGQIDMKTLMEPLEEFIPKKTPKELLILERDVKSLNDESITLNNQPSNLQENNQQINSQVTHQENLKTDISQTITLTSIEDPNIEPELPSEINTKVFDKTTLIPDVIFPDTESKLENLINDAPLLRSEMLNVRQSDTLQDQRVDNHDITPSQIHEIYNVKESEVTAEILPSVDVHFDEIELDANEERLCTLDTSELHKQE